MGKNITSRVRYSYDPSKVYTKHPNGTLRVEDYQWVYGIRKDGIAMIWTEWLSNNCRYPWGWWFDSDGQCQVGFTDRDEMLHFAMHYL